MLKRVTTTVVRMKKEKKTEKENKTRKIENNLWNKTWEISLMTKILQREDQWEVLRIEGVTVIIEEVVLEIDIKVDTIICMQISALRCSMNKTTTNMVLVKAETEGTTQEEVTMTLPYKQVTEKEEDLADHTINKIQGITTIATMNKIMIITIDNIDILELNNICTMMVGNLKWDTETNLTGKIEINGEMVHRIIEDIRITECREEVVDL